MKRTLNQFDAREIAPTPDIPEAGESLTVPDMALSMRELLQRQTRGQDVPYFPLQYDGDEFDDLPDFRMMDEVEKLIWANNARKELEGKYPRQQDENWSAYLARVQREKRLAQAQAEMAEAEKNPPTDPPAGQASGEKT